MIGVQLSAVDTLYFRNSTAYAASLTSPEHHSGHFPPHPTTIVGAIRAWLARGQGWRNGSWPDNLTSVLGDGPDNLGQLRFDAPYLLRNGEPLFAMPAHLLGVTGKTWEPQVALRPGRQVMCDLGEGVRLPEYPAVSAQTAQTMQTPATAKANEQLKPGTDLWLTRAGMRAVLYGGVPKKNEVVRSDELWHDELRVGIRRDDTTRTVQEGELYTSRHVRPGNTIAIGVRFDGVPDGWLAQCPAVVPLGGEARWAERQAWDGDARCPVPLTEILEKRTAMVIALTPIDADEAFCRPGGCIAELGDAAIVSACLPRVERVGGWASYGRTPGPVPLRSILPAGSTFFCEVGDPEGLRTAIEHADGPPRIGRRQAWGFGAVAIGVWPTTTEVMR